MFMLAELEVIQAQVLLMAATMEAEPPMRQVRENRLAAVAAAVNESTWEHMKLLFVPVFVWSVVQLWFHGRNYPNFLAVRAASTLAGLALIPVLYYTYTGALGQNISLVNITIFQLAVLLAFAVSFSLRKRQRLSGGLWPVVSGAVLLVVTALFIWWTFAPPQLPLFVDPATGLTGRG